MIRKSGGAVFRKDHARIRASVLIVAARRIVLARLLLVVALLAIRRVVAIARLRQLLIGLRAIVAVDRARRREARAGVASISGVDVVVILRHVATGRLGRRRQAHGIA